MCKRSPIHARSCFISLTQFLPSFFLLSCCAASPPDVTFNVTGNARQIFSETPNEYARMRFDGLNTMTYDFTRMKAPYGGEEQQAAANTGALDVQQGEAQHASHDHLHELSYEEANALAGGLPWALLMRLPLHGWIHRALDWMQA